MSGKRTMVIVGASLAGARAAEALRDEGFEGGIVLVGAEAERPYERPPLSKGYLQDKTERDAVYVHPEDFYDDRDIELRTATRAAAVDPHDSVVVLESGERLAYDRLLLATGSEPRALDVPGATLPGVHLLRTLEDADRLRDALDTAHAVVVIGSGWIGAEVAASARTLGKDVTLVGRGAVPLERVLGPEIGAIYRQLHADHGVQLVTNTEVESIQGHDTVEAVRTTDGRTVDGDLVVVGVGATPRLELARGAGLTIDGGVVTDEGLRSSVDSIYAAGDIAAAWHPFFNARLRVEHWANATHQGRLAARNMLGAGVSYDRIPYFFSDQFDLGMEYSGYAPEWDQVVFRGDTVGREFVAFWIHDGRVVAGMNANTWDLAEPIQELIRTRRPVDLKRLADPEIPIGELHREALSR
jgi:3-phenylpropionate/trans-cinnamate dioxygenase ferredoxin reductase subunit